MKTLCHILVFLHLHSDFKIDPWFSGPCCCPTGKGQDYMEKEAEIKQQEEENRQYWTNESD